MSGIVVIGSGMSAYGAAHVLGPKNVETTYYDREKNPGGHTISLKYAEGFTFDIGPHVSFTSDERIQGLFAEFVGGEYETHDYKFSNYWEGCWLNHPAQTNLYGLPPEVIVKVIADFVEETGRERTIENYEDWLTAAYGKTFAEWFPGRYTYKYHTTEAVNLTTDWMGPRMYRPRLEEMLLGAVTKSTPNVHYIRQFRYPRDGGFVSYLSRWHSNPDLKLEHEITEIDPATRSLTFRDGQRAGYDGLISSVPLPELVKLIKGAPPEVLAAAAKLACSSCVLVNIGVDRPDIADVHISYFYDLDIIFPRTSYPHLMAASNAPPDCGSVQVEIYFSPKYRPFTGKPEDYIEPTIEQLKRCGVFRDDERILMKDAVFIPYANIIFDHDRTSALETVQGYLEEIGVFACGRFGEWAYFWTDDSFRSGEAAAEKALEWAGARTR